MSLHLQVLLIARHAVLERLLYAHGLLDLLPRARPGVVSDQWDDVLDGCSQPSLAVVSESRDRKDKSLGKRAMLLIYIYIYIYM